jgi:hypothetical protein
MRIVDASELPIAERVSGVPLNVAFAAGEAIEALRSRNRGHLDLAPPFHVSGQDAYLVLPADIGLELVDIFRDGDLDRIDDTMREGLIAIGTIEKKGPGRMTLCVEQSARPRELLPTLPYVETVGIGRGIDPIPLLNALDHVQCTVASEFFDDSGLEAVLRAREYAGISWGMSNRGEHRAYVDPTYVWSRWLPDGRIGIECALFTEYEELVVVLRPAALAPLDRLAPALGAY